MDDGEEKKEDDDYEEEMEGKTRDEEEMQDSLVVSLSSFLCTSCFKVLSAKKK